MAFVFDLILFPLGKKTAWWGLVLSSILSALLILVFYRLLSKPARSRRIKDRIKACILALRIYRDFSGVMLRSLFHSLFLTLRYIGQNLIPLIAITPFLLILFLQIDLRFGSRPFQKNETFVVKAKFRTDLDAISIELEKNPLAVPTMNPVRIKALREIDWKLEAIENGVTTLRFKTGSEIIAKEIVVGPVMRILPEEISSSKLYHFLFATESLLPRESVIESISIDYPARRIHLFRYSASWILYYLLLVIMLALALKKRFGVEF